jgi:hypothetical protein
MTQKTKAELLQEIEALKKRQLGTPPPGTVYVIAAGSYECEVQSCNNYAANIIITPKGTEFLCDDCYDNATCLLRQCGIKISEIP